MKRRIAVVGDTLSCGGEVLDYVQGTGFRFHGHKAALLGKEAFCLTCKSTGILAKAGGPYRLQYETTHHVALDGDIVLCQCSTPPRITASLAGESWCEDRDYEYARRVELDGEHAAQVEYAHQRHDEQFALVDAAHNVVPDTPYTVFLPSGERIHGMTDSRGRTRRYQTDSAQSIKIYLGHR
jgi:hypothetical protein